MSLKDLDYKVKNGSIVELAGQPVGDINTRADIDALSPEQKAALVQLGRTLHEEVKKRWSRERKG